MIIKINVLLYLVYEIIFLSLACIPSLFIFFIYCKKALQQFFATFLVFRLNFLSSCVSSFIFRKMNFFRFSDSFTLYFIDLLPAEVSIELVFLWSPFLNPFYLFMALFGWRLLHPKS